MEVSSVGKCEYGGKGRWVKYLACLGWWVSPCFGPFSLGARIETYEPFTSIIFRLFLGCGKLQILNQRIWGHDRTFITEVLKLTSLLTLSSGMLWTIGIEAFCRVWSCFLRSAPHSAHISFITVGCVHSSSCRRTSLCKQNTIMNLCNENQPDALFFLNLFHHSTSTYLLYIYKRLRWCSG
jgi:hypothetical protein